MNKCVAACCLMAMVVVVAAAVEAANCNPLELSPCLGAISRGENPTTECCTRLKEQESCLCSYMNNPFFKPYVDSPNAKKVAAQCGVPTPAC